MAASLTQSPDRHDFRRQTVPMPDRIDNAVVQISTLLFRRAPQGRRQNDGRVACMDEQFERRCFDREIILLCVR
jgi:hypothetical protein